MPQRTTNSGKSKKKDTGKLSRRGRKRGWITTAIIFSVVMVVVFAGIGIFYYRTYVAPFQQVVLTVDNRAIRMDYFLKRIKMSGGDPALTLEQLTYEQVVKLIAPQYDIAVSPSDIDAELRKEAAVSSTDAITEAGFQEWYINRLKETGLSDPEYREMAEANLLATRLLELVAANMPATAAQIHVYRIVTATREDAVKARSRIAAGENFAAVAAEMSLDSQTKSRGGDLGWMPHGLTPYDEVIFPLAAGQVSPPVAFDPDSSGSNQYAIFLVSEKDPNRTIDASQLGVLRSRALYNLIQQQIPQHVKYSYTPEDNAWVTEQLAKTAESWSAVSGSHRQPQANSGIPSTSSSFPFSMKLRC